jgi:uncharacterized membrane protein
MKSTLPRGRNVWPITGSRPHDGRRSTQALAFSAHANEFARIPVSQSRSDCWLEANRIYGRSGISSGNRRTFRTSAADGQNHEKDRQMAEEESLDLTGEIVDFDAGEGEAATVEMDDYSKSLAAAKAKSVKLVDAITGAVLKKKEAIHFDDLRPALADFVRLKHPGIRSDDYISRKVVDDYRGQYIAELLRDERGELSNLEDEVVESLRSHDTLAENIEEDYEEGRTLGDRVADVVATFGGSWTFIISFCMFLAVWMGFNLALGEKNAFDVYPFILLNLILSTIAALQAPIIMMSQRRQEAKDRLRALNDYKVNLKAELEIRHLHEKVDHLLNRQWERLTEIQQIQIEMMLEQAKAANRALKMSKASKTKANALKNLFGGKPRPNEADETEE